MLSYRENDLDVTGDFSSSTVLVTPKTEKGQEFLGCAVASITVTRTGIEEFARRAWSDYDIKVAGFEFLPAG